MNLKRLVVPMELKDITEKGVVSGYASIFGNVDLGGDVIVKGEPFKDIVRGADGRVKMLFQHDSSGFTESGGLPIGTAEVEQNAKGLKFDAQLVMDDPFVQRVHTHMKAGTLDGMSIGFDILPGGAKILESGVRELSAMRLWEISAVTFGMNPKARIGGVKAAGINTVRQFEELLMDVLWDANVNGKRCTRDDVKLLASSAWKGFVDARDVLGEKAASDVLSGMAERIFGAR